MVGSNYFADKGAHDRVKMLVRTLPKSIPDSVIGSQLLLASLHLSPSEAMAVSQNDCEMLGESHGQGRSSRTSSILRQALTCSVGHRDGYAMIEMLPNDVLLEIFDAHRILSLRHKFLDKFYDCSTWDWDKLVHVCRRWRQLIFASPLRLSIQLHCTKGIDVKKFLGCWPAFPITLDYTFGKGIGPDDGDNILTALEHSDRVHHLRLHITDKQLAKLATAMQKPFPKLTTLELSRENRSLLGLPPGLLGRSAPRLQELDLEEILFPNFLLSSRDLVTLRLYGIRLKSISPETMVTCLAPLTRLTSLYIGDHFYDSYESTLPSAKLDPARTRIVLPALTSIEFESDIHYIEDFVARVDCPQLNSFDLYPRNSSDDIDLQLSQTYKFLNRSDPLLTCFDSVYAIISFEKITFRVCCNSDPYNSISITLWGENWRHSHIFQLFSQFSPLLSNVHHLTF